MRLREIMEDSSAAATTSGAVAVAVRPLGEIQRRIPEQGNTAKYSNRPVPDYASPQRKKNAR
jgi:hypothetical protein